MQTFLQELEKHGKEIVFQFSLGAEALPFESGMRLRQQTLAQLADLIYRYPNLHFMCFNIINHCAPLFVSSRIFLLRDFGGIVFSLEQ